MNVLIITNGGSGIGLGHVARCDALGVAFAEGGWDVLLVVDGPRSLIKIIDTKKIVFIPWVSDITKVIPYLTRDIDLVVIDSYLINPTDFKKICSKVRYSLTFDDAGDMSLLSDFIVSISSLEYYGANDKCILLNGLEYQVLRRPFWGCSRREVKAHIQNVFISLGGDDIREMSPGLYSELVLCHPDYRYYLLTSSHSRSLSSLKRIMRPSDSLVLDSDAQTIKSIMMKVDIAITSGGQTIFELAACGVPSVIIQVIDNQKKNINMASKYGFGLLSLVWNDPDIANKIDRILNTCDEQERTEQSLIGVRMVDGFGAQRIVACIERNMENS